MYDRTAWFISRFMTLISFRALKNGVRLIYLEFITKMADGALECCDGWARLWRARCPHQRQHSGSVRLYLLYIAPNKDGTDRQGLNYPSRTASTD